MTKFLTNFWADESGAVTVDWVVLTAAVCALALAAYTTIKNASSSLTSRTSTWMDTLEPSGTL